VNKHYINPVKCVGFSQKQTSSSLHGNVTCSCYDIAENCVSVHLAERVQRRRLKCEKLMDDGCQKLTLP
jgi:hypothetical protein